MLAAVASKEQITHALESSDWLAELKLDGCRYVMDFSGGKIKVTSRRTSVKTGEAVDKTENVPHFKYFSWAEGTVLDGEIMSKDISLRSNDVVRIMGCKPEKAIARQKKEGRLRYHAFDILFYKGKDVQGFSYLERRKLLDDVLDMWDCPFVEMVDNTNHKQDLLDKAWYLGLEGIVLKHIDSTYQQDTRCDESWIKVKKQRDFDVVITGFDQPHAHTYVKVKPKVHFGSSVDKEGVRWWKTYNRFYKEGWIAAIRYGATDEDGRLVTVGSTSGIDDTLRAKMSERPRKYIGKVIELVAQEFMDNGLRSPRFSRFRPDKDPKDCKLSDLKAVDTKKSRYV